MNLYLTGQPTSQPFDFGKIEEVQGETTEAVVTARRERGRKEESSLSCLRCFIFCKMKLYVLQQNVTTATRKARVMCFDADVLNPLTFTEETEREISVKGICDSLKESFIKNKIIEMTDERVHTLSILHNR